MTLLWFCLSFMAGILLGAQFALSQTFWLVGACIFLFVWITLALVGRKYSSDWLSVLNERLSFRAYGRTIPILGLAAAFCFGAARYMSTQPVLSPASIAWYVDQQEPLAITGVIESYPDRSDNTTSIHVSVEKVECIPDLEKAPVCIFEQPVPDQVTGLLLARLHDSGNWHYGDRVLLQGDLEAPPDTGDFSYRDYLARQGIYAYMPYARARLLEHGQGNYVMAQIYALRERLLEIVYQIFPDPEAPLMAGILLGLDNDISQPLANAFRQTGTSHIIAISGFNIAIIAALFSLLFGRLLRHWKGVIAAVVAIGLYTVMVGASASVLRAAVMGSLALFAQQIGRRSTGWHTLIVTAAGMCLFNPQLPWDVSFQLSFMATLGLIVYGERFQEAALRVLSRWASAETAQRFAGYIAEYLLLTLAAQIATLPVIAYHFGTVSLTALLANPVILPVQPIVMVLGGISALAGLLYMPVGKILAWLTYPFVAFTIRAVEWLARIPQGQLNLGEFDLTFVVLIYAILAWITFGVKRWEKIKRWVTPAVLFLSVWALSVVIWRTALYLPDGRLHLTFLGDGAGSIMIQTPAGGHVLVNGGESAQRLSDTLGRRLSIFQRRLDWLLVIGGKSTQLAALPTTLERYPVGQVLWVGKMDTSTASHRLDNFLLEHDVPVEPAQTGQSLDLGSGAVIRLLSVIDQGAVLSVEWNNFRAFLPIGITTKAKDALPVLSPMHGPNVVLLAQKEAPTRAWCEQTLPQLIVWDKAGNEYQPPSPEEIEPQCPLIRTEQNGWIHIMTDGNYMWIETERE